jgi:heat shock protein beta
VWQSTAGSDFTIVEDPRGATMEHGTRVSLSLKDDALEFLEPGKIRVRCCCC